MSLPNVKCENEFNKTKSVSEDYFNEKLEGNTKTKIHSEITCKRKAANIPSNQITVATMINQTQIQNVRFDEEEGDFASKPQDGESFSTSRKSLRKVFVERRLKSRKKSKSVKNQTRRQIPYRRKVCQIAKTRLKKRKSKLGKEEKDERKRSEGNVCVERCEERPKRGKRGLVGGKAKAKPPIEDSDGTHDSDEDNDSFHFYRISLGCFQKFRDVQGASTSTRHEKLDKTPPFFRARRLEAKTSEERELLELKRWGMASLITDESGIVETDKLQVNKNSSDHFERDEIDSKAYNSHNNLYQDLNYIKDPLIHVRKMESDTELRSSVAKPQIHPKSEGLVFGSANYQWIQTPESISVEIKCPVYVVRSNQVSIKTTPVSLEIDIKSSDESEWTPFFNCNLAGRIYPEGSTWCLGPCPSILIHLKKYKNDFWESFTKSLSEFPDTEVDESQTDLGEFYQPALLNIIKNISVIKIDKACTKDPIKRDENKSEVCGYTKELRDVVESGEEVEKVEEFE